MFDFLRGFAQVLMILSFVILLFIIDRISIRNM